ncbi:MAG: DUF1320 domain-containing protein [Magnetococcales bacterium]|nr:DUF1320 domain-containing protein [Magnetococcales bacterium]
MSTSLYVTINDLICWFGAREITAIASPDHGAILTEAQMLNPDGPEATAAANRILDAITHASRVADSHLSRRHALPLDAAVVADSPLARYCGDITRFLLWDDKPSETVRDRHDRAVKWLEAVATGKATLGGIAPPPPAAAGIGSPAFVAGFRQFDGEALQGF